MSEKINVDRQRMNARIATTWVALLIGITAGIMFVMTAFEVETQLDPKIILVPIVTIFILNKLHPKIVSWYEKRLESKNKST